MVKFNIADNLAWEELPNLAKLRNTIVHRRGLLGPNEEERRTITMLVHKYTGELSISGPPDSPQSELEVSATLCFRFLDTIEDFFDRLFQEVGFPKDGFTMS